MVRSLAPLYCAPDPPGSHEVLKARHIQFQQRRDGGRINDRLPILKLNLHGLVRTFQFPALPSRRQLFVGGAEKLVVDAVGGDASISQTADEVAQERPRPAKIDVRLGQRGVDLKPIEGDPGGSGAQ